MAVTMSYPKPRSLLTKVIEILRTDNATVKAWLPRGAIIMDVDVFQKVDATTDAGGVDVGLNANGDAILDGFVMATTAVGLVKPGTTVGTAVMGAPLAADSAVPSTYIVGDSTAGGTGLVAIHYILPGSGEVITS